jgi:putative transposase
MPWGLQRFHHSGQSHFITFCCYHRRTYLTTDAARSTFVSALERVRRSFGLCVYGYGVWALIWGALHPIPDMMQQQIPRR